jgi:hypothetical protein
MNHSIVRYTAFFLFFAHNLFRVVYVNAQQENNLFLGGTVNASFMSVKPITNSPWDSPTRRYSVSIRPEIGLVSEDQSGFFGFGLGFQTWKGMNLNADERFFGLLAGAYYRKVFAEKFALSPFIEGGLDVALGQSKVQMASSDMFSGHLFSRLGMLYNPNNKWLFFMGINVLSLQYDRYSSSQIFRAGLHNVGSINLNLIRLLK